MNATSGILLLGLAAGGIAVYSYWQSTQSAAAAAKVAAAPVTVGSGPTAGTCVTGDCSVVAWSDGSITTVGGGDTSLSGLGAIGNTFKIRGAGGWAA